MVLELRARLFCAHLLYWLRSGEMGTPVVNWLASVGSTAFAWSATAFILVNGAALAAVAMTRDRSLVNRWTGTLLGINLALAGTGLGIPLVTSLAQLAVSAVTPAVQAAMPAAEPTGPSAANRSSLPRSH
jgi:hypothetical protein